MPKETRDKRPDKNSKLKHLMEHLNTYRVLFFVWLIVGLATLILGNISRITYACVWVLLLFEYLARSMEE